MEKIPTLFQRDSDFRVIDKVTPGCEWVLAGEGVATRKFDGTCCRIHEGKLYKRSHWAPNCPMPEGFRQTVEAADSGSREGWIEVGDWSGDQWHREAFEAGVDWHGDPFRDGTYELLGPKVQGNPERCNTHTLLRHGSIECCPVGRPERTFTAIQTYLNGRDMEGIVWHHPDGRMAKIKGRDFGFTRPKHQNELQGPSC